MHKRAMKLYLPKSIYDSFYASNETRKSTLVIHGTNLEILSLENMRYTNNTLEITLEPNETAVSFDSNGGAGTMKDQDITYGTAARLNQTGYTKYGHTFVGWNTKKDGSGKTYADKQEASTAFPTQKEVKLYAQWKEKLIEAIKLNKKIMAVKKGSKGKINIVKVEKKGTKDDNILGVMIQPEDVLNKKLTYTSSKPKIATIDKNGNIRFKKVGKTMITVRSANGKTAKCEVYVNGKQNGAWRRETNADRNKGGCHIMQGMAGVGNRIYFIKIMKNNKKAALFSADISAKGIKNIHFIGYFNDLYHANSMTAVGTKNNTDLYVAPCIKSRKGFVCKIKIVNGKVKKQKVIKKGKTVREKVVRVSLIGKRLNKKDISGISHFYKDRKLYFVLKNGRSNWVAELTKLTEQKKENKMKCLSKFNTREDKFHSKISYQGATCEFDDKGNYYVPLSFRDSVRKKDNRSKGKLRSISVIEVYHLDITDNCRKVEPYYTKTLVLKAGKKIASKKPGFYTKFEMEDLYINDKNSRIYFNSEGGQGHKDIIGSMKLGRAK